MRIREAVEKNFNALPGYKLVGYNEIAIPIFQRRLHVLTLAKKSLPVVEQFVLNFYREGVELNDINELLGLNQQLIDEAWAGLIQKDYINNFTRTITDSGLEYLKENKIEKLEKHEIQISIDGLTGKISKVNTQLMLGKVVREKGIKSLKSNYSQIKLEDIDFKSVKKVYKQYQQKDSENYSGDLLDIIEMEGNTTRYRRIDVLFFQNSDKNDLRVLAYDDYNKVEEYEERLLAIENESNVILKYNIDNYFNESQIKDIDFIIQNANKDECKHISIDNVNNEWNKYLYSKEEDLIIITPLISQCRLNGAFIEHLEALIKEKTNVNYIISGRDFSNEYQKNNCLLLKNLNKYKNFKFKQIPVYINKMIIDLNKSEALVSIYEKNEIISNGSQKGIIEKVYKLSENAFSNLYTKVVSIINTYNIPKLKGDYSNNEKLKIKIEKISILVKDCDSYMYSNDNIGWVGESGIPDINKLLEAPVAKNKENFKIFIDSFNKSLVESLESNAKIKGKKKYFWNEFKNEYGNLQQVLDKIKTYRNKSNHLKLDDLNKNKYFNYLKEDLNGYIPEFIDNGYLILQEKIILQLEESIRKTMVNLR